MPVFTPTQLKLQEAVRRMVETEVAPIAQSMGRREKPMGIRALGLH